MTARACAAPLGLETLARYWLEELDPAALERVEEHVFSCDTCIAQLQELQSLAAGIAALARRGAVGVVVPADLPRRLAADGLQVREYRVPPNGSVQCTIGPDDAAVIAQLAAPLANVERVDLEAVDGAGRALGRLADVPFDPAAGAIFVCADAATLRALPKTSLHYRMLAREGADDRLLGEYTFNHTPWPDS